MSWKDISDSITDQCVDAFSELIEVHYFNSLTNLYDVSASRGVYDSDYKQIDLQTGAVISSSAPMVEVSLRSITRMLNNKDKIQVRGILYRVKEVQPDASGAIKILLSRSSAQ